MSTCPKPGGPEPPGPPLPQPGTTFPVLILMIHGSNSNGNDRDRDDRGENPLVSAHGAGEGILAAGTFAGPSRFTFSVRTLNLEQEGFGRIMDRSRKEHRWAGIEGTARSGPGIDYGNLF